MDANGELDATAECCEGTGGVWEEVGKTWRNAACSSAKATRSLVPACFDISLSDHSVTQRHETPTPKDCGALFQNPYAQPFGR